MGRVQSSMLNLGRRSGRVGSRPILLCSMSFDDPIRHMSMWLSASLMFADGKREFTNNYYRAIVTENLQKLK